MSEEEIEAIEQLKSWRNFVINNRDKVSQANELDYYLRTVIDIVENQQTRIDKTIEYIENVEEEAKSHKKIDKKISRIKEGLTTDYKMIFMSRKLLQILKGENENES